MKTPTTTREELRAYYLRVIRNPHEQTRNRLRASELLAKLDNLYQTPSADMDYEHDPDIYP